MGTPAGLYCVPGDFYVDPVAPVERAVLTHGHADHARPGHKNVLGTSETIAIFQLRHGESAKAEALAYRQPLAIDRVKLTFFPAGHVLGSAQVLLEYRGKKALLTGDFKRDPDPTCAPFEPQKADLLISEATFGLPIFRNPPPEEELDKLLRSIALFPERAHLIGVYVLGKCQRLIAMLRRRGYDRPIYLHGALIATCELYESCGITLGPLKNATEAGKDELSGAVVLAPPSALLDRWSRRIPDPVRAYASGWMRVKARAKQMRVELPLVISDHADWDALLATAEEIAPREVWVTHGHEEALVHALQSRGVSASALHLAGYEEEPE